MLKIVLIIMFLANPNIFRSDGTKRLSIFRAIIKRPQLLKEIIDKGDMKIWIPQWNELMAKDNYCFNDGIMKHTFETIKYSHGIARFLMFFHDLGKLHPAYVLKDKHLHPYYSAIIARPIFKSFGIKKKRIDQYCCLIESHHIIGEFPLNYTKQALTNLLDVLETREMIGLLEQMSIADVTKRSWLGKYWNIRKIKTSFQLIRDYKDGYIKFEDLEYFFTKSSYIKYRLEKILNLIPKMKIHNWFISGILDCIFMYDDDIEDFKCIDNIMMSI